MQGYPQRKRLQKRPKTFNYLHLHYREVKGIVKWLTKAFCLKYNHFYDLFNNLLKKKKQVYSRKES